MEEIAEKSHSRNSFVRNSRSLADLHSKAIVDTKLILERVGLFLIDFAKTPAEEKIRVGTPEVT